MVDRQIVVPKVSPDRDLAVVVAGGVVFDIGYRENPGGTGRTLIGQRYRRGVVVGLDLGPLRGALLLLSGDERQP